MRAMVLDEVGAPLREAVLPDPSRRPDRSCSACSPAGSAAPTSTSSTASSRVRSCRSSPAIRSSGVVEAAATSTGSPPGDRVGVPWLGWTCGECRYCRAGGRTSATARASPATTIDGGYAELHRRRRALLLPDSRRLPRRRRRRRCSAPGSSATASLRLAGDARAARPLRLRRRRRTSSRQVARHAGTAVLRLHARGRRRRRRRSPRSLGAAWAGDALAGPPEELDAAIIFAPVGELVPAALRAVRKGGTVVCAGIHMSDIPSFPYELLWGERTVRSVANLTRADGEEFLALAPQRSRAHGGRDVPARAGERGTRAPSERRAPRGCRARP